MYKTTDLLAQLLLTKFVESVEFLCKDYVLLETTARQLHSDNDRTIRNHHCHCSEIDLQVLWQLLTTSVSWILKHNQKSQVQSKVERCGALACFFLLSTWAYNRCIPRSWVCWACWNPQSLDYRTSVLPESMTIVHMKHNQNAKNAVQWTIKNFTYIIIYTKKENKLMNGMTNSWSNLNWLPLSRRSQTPGPSRPCLHQWKWTETFAPSCRLEQSQSAGQQRKELEAQFCWTHRNNPRNQTAPNLVYKWHIRNSWSIVFFNLASSNLYSVNWLGYHPLVSLLNPS